MLDWVEYTDSVSNRDENHKYYSAELGFVHLGINGPDSSEEVNKYHGYAYIRGDFYSSHRTNTEEDWLCYDTIISDVWKPTFEECEQAIKKEIKSIIKELDNVVQECEEDR